MVLIHKNTCILTDSIQLNKYLMHSNHNIKYLPKQDCNYMYTE